MDNLADSLLDLKVMSSSMFPYTDSKGDIISGIFDQHRSILYCCEELYDKLKESDDIASEFGGRHFIKVDSKAINDSLYRALEPDFSTFNKDFN